MQSGGQYGVPEIQQFMVDGCSPHLFAISHHDNIVPVPPPPPASQNKHHRLIHHHPHRVPQQQQIQNVQSHQQQAVQQLGLGSGSPESRPGDLTAIHVSSFKHAGLQGRDQPLSTDDDGVGEDGERGCGANRWPREETLALLRVRSGMDSNFRDSNVKAPLWEDVSRKLAGLGYQRSAKKCKEKFENVNKYYKKTKDGRIGRQDGKSYRFFTELEALYGGNLHSVGASTNGINNNTGVIDRTASNIAQGVNAGCANSALTATGIAAQGRPIAETSNARLNLSSDTSEDEYRPENPEPPKTQQQDRKKRKRKHLQASMAMFFESLVKQLMDHQEALHRKFMEAIERRDDERLNREEAWKRQEMARLSREAELRAQEHALASTREAAIVAFLQKFTGENLKLPTSPSAPAIVSSDQQDQDQQERDLSDPHSKRWPKMEVNALIRLRTSMEPRFQEPGPKGPLWEEISSGMKSLGFHRSAKRCKEKWENINKYFRRTKDATRKRPENSKTCPYFHQLDILYGKGVLSASTKSTKGELGHSSDALLDQAARDEDISDNHNDQQANQTVGSDSELLAMVPSDQAAGGGSAAPSRNNTTVQYFFESSDDHHEPADQTQKRYKMNDRNQLEMINHSSNQLTPRVEGLNPTRDHHPQQHHITHASAKTSNMERLMLEMQQQKFLDDFGRREHGDQQNLSDQERHYHRREAEDQLRMTQDERSQSALMALVHKLTVNGADDYAMSAPSSTE